jgi:hypothetical protein
MNPARDGDRFWWSTSDTTTERHLTLGRLATQTAASGVAGAVDVGIINERANVIYASFGSSMRSYNNTTNVWSANLVTLDANATDSLNIRLGNTEYLVIAHTTGYVYFDGTTWTADTRDAQYLAFWDDRLWGIDTTGLLWSSGTIGVEEDDAQLPLPNSSVTGLFVGRAPDGDEILYAATTVGLYAHNADAQRFERVQPHLPRHPDNGLGALSWREAAYIPAGLGIYQYVSGANAVVTTIGLDQDQGVPSAYRGRIRKLIPTHNDLVALLDAATSSAAPTLFTGDGLSDADSMDPNRGRAAMMAWNGRGWRALWTADADALPITTGHISNAYNMYRLWWGHDGRVYWMEVPRDVVSPTQISDNEYAASSTHETPWFDGDETHNTKTGIVVCVDTTGMSATETITLRRRLNFDDSVANQTSFAVITTNGHTEYLLPNATTPEGLLFRQIKFVVDLARGSVSTNSPDLNRLDFYFIRTEDVRWGVSCTILIPAEGDFGQSPELMYDNLITAAENDLLVQVTWRDRDANTAGTVNPYNYYMKIGQFTGVEGTGHDFSGQFQVGAIER